MRGIKLEAMADIRQSRKKKLLATFSVIAFAILSVYSYVNYSEEKELIALTNGLGALLCLAHLCSMMLSRTATVNPLIPSVAVLINAFVNIASPHGTILWVYPIVAAILMVNEFRHAVIYTLVFFAGAGLIFFVEENSAVHYISYQNLSEDKFLLSMMTLCLVILISNYGYKTASEYLQSLYQEGIDQLAYRDRLTGLANRWSFEVWSKEKLAQADSLDSVTALLFMDIDNFKTINDTHGHDTGDKLLQKFARRLESNMRSKDRKTDKDDYSVARYAGDEFMILLHDIPTIEDVEHIVQRVNKLFDHEISQSDIHAHLTFSIGVSVYGQDAGNLEELIRCADKAMYQAKNLGKNRYRFYHSSQHEPLGKKPVSIKAGISS